jgi:two-component system response regulator HupR/HoxA
VNNAVVSRPSSRLLLVDDDLALLNALSGTLQNRLGHYTLDTSQSQTGMQALECVKASAYDTIITDENMPGMSGLQLLKAVKQYCPDACRADFRSCRSGVDR